MPNQSFQESDFCEDVTVQQVTLVAVVVHQGQCNGVGVAHTLTRYGSIASLDVVDGLIGRGGQRVGNHTFVLVGLQQLFRCMRVGGVEAEFQPGLQLGIEVDAGTVTHEVRTDDGTILVHIVGTDIVLDSIGSALCAHLVLVLQGSTENGILPVGTLA